MKLAQGLTALRRRLGVDQVGKTFDGGEIELAVLESAAGELAGFRRAQAFDARKRRERAGDHRAAAVQLKLGDILAGLARRRRKKKRERLVDDFAALRVAHPCERRAPRRRCAADQRMQRRGRARAGDADHGNRGRRAAGGEGVNGVAIAQALALAGCGLYS